MDSTEFTFLHDLNIEIKQGILNLCSTLKNILKDADISTMEIYKGEGPYDLILNLKNIATAVYLEGPYKFDNECVNILLFLEKYYQRMKDIKPYPAIFLIYTNFKLPNQINFVEEETFNNDTFQFLNHALIMNLVKFTGRLNDKEENYAAFLFSVRFYNHEIINLAEIDRTHLCDLKEVLQHFNTGNVMEILNTYTNPKQCETCEDFSKINLGFINQCVHVNFKTNYKTWEKILNDRCIHSVYVNAGATLLTIMKVVNYVKKKGFNFMLLYEQQLEFKNLSTAAFDLLFTGEVHILIIEYRKGANIGDRLLYSNEIRSMKTGKIVHVFESKNYKSVLAREDLKCIPKARFLSDYISFGDLDKSSQKSLLNVKIIFQGIDINLGDITDCYVALSCLYHTQLEDIIAGRGLVVGREIRYNFDSVLCLQRTLRRQIVPDRLLRTDLSNSNLVIVCGENLENIEEQRDAHLNRGILIVPDQADALRTFQEYSRQETVGNIYLVEYKNGLFFLENCKTIDSVIINRLKDDPHAEQIDTDALSHKKINIIIGNPGMGKSSLLNSIAIQLKCENPYTWVVYVNLGFNSSYRNHIETAMGDTDDDIENWAVDFLTPAVIGTDPASEESNFTAELFKFGFDNYRSARYNCPKYIFLFDAFDELKTRHQDKVIGLVSFLVSKSFTKNLWITSKPHMKQRLEEALQTVALSINPLISSQKDEYIRYVFDRENILYKMTYSKYRNKLESIISTLENNTANFADNPLHLEYLSFTFKELSKFNISLYNLLKQFISYKFNVYPNVVDRKMHIHQYHRELAVSLCDFADILHDSPKPKSKTERNNKKKTNYKCKIKREELFGIGLVALEDGELTFIHPLIQAYFIATQVKKTPQMLARILSERKYDKVRHVMNSMSVDKLKTIDSNHWKVDNPSMVLKMLTTEKNKLLAKLLIDTLFS